MSGSSFTDPDGVILGVEACDDEPGCVHIGVGMETACAGPDDFPAIITALYAAAGLPEPVVLERPEVDTSAETGINAFKVWRGADRGSVRLGLWNGSVALAPHVARHLASVLAAYADAAENKPDPAEVEELTRILRGITPGMADSGTGDYKTAVVRPFAEAALRWMAGRQPRGEAS